MALLHVPRVIFQLLEALALEAEVNRRLDDALLSLLKVFLSCLDFVFPGSPVCFLSLEFLHESI